MTPQTRASGWPELTVISSSPSWATNRECLEDLCFEAQQAAEKALKAVCVHYRLDFPKTHSLVLLMDILESSGLHIPPQVKAADILTQYAVQARYPGLGEAITEAEYHHVLELAQQLVSWAEVTLAGS